MFNGLKIGQTGMNTAQKVMDNVADKIANGSTPGYKKAQVGFQELLRNEMGSQEVPLGQKRPGEAMWASVPGRAAEDGLHPRGDPSHGGPLGSGLGRGRILWGPLGKTEPWP